MDNETSLKSCSVDISTTINMNIANNICNSHHIINNIIVTYASRCLQNLHFPNSRQLISDYYSCTCVSSNQHKNICDNDCETHKLTNKNMSDRYALLLHQKLKNILQTNESPLDNLIKQVLELSCISIDILQLSCNYVNVFGLSYQQFDNINNDQVLYCERLLCHIDENIVEFATHFLDFLTKQFSICAKKQILHGTQKKFTFFPGLTIFNNNVILVKEINQLTKLLSHKNITIVKSACKIFYNLVIDDEYHQLYFNNIFFLLKHIDTNVVELALYCLSHIAIYHMKYLNEICEHIDVFIELLDNPNKNIVKLTCNLIGIIINHITRTYDIKYFIM